MPQKKKFKHSPNWVTIYTDASFKDGSGSWACWLRSSSGRIVRSGECPREVQTSNQAELYAVYMALDIIQKELPRTRGGMINSDSQLVVSKISPNATPIQGASAKWQKLCHEIIKENNWHIKTKHIKAHQKVRCTRTFINNQVDELARKALPEASQPSVWSKISGKIKKWWYKRKKAKSRIPRSQPYSSKK